MKRREFLTRSAAASALLLTGRHHAWGQEAASEDGKAAVRLKNVLTQLGIVENPNDKHVSPSFTDLAKRYPALNHIRKSLCSITFSQELAGKDPAQKPSRRSIPGSAKILAVSDDKVILSFAKHMAVDDQFDFRFFAPGGFWIAKQGAGIVTYKSDDPTIDDALGHIDLKLMTGIPEDAVRQFKSEALPIKWGSNAELASRTDRLVDSAMDIMASASSNDVKRERLAQLLAPKDDPKVLIAGFPGIADHTSIAMHSMLHAVEARFRAFEPVMQMNAVALPDASSYQRRCLMLTDAVAYKGMSGGGVFSPEGACLGTMSLTAPPFKAPAAHYLPIEFTQAAFVKTYPEIAAKIGIKEPAMPARIDACRLKKFATAQPN